MTTFVEAFGRPPDGVWAAPGRVNLIGEHTDYNDGFALPVALQLRVTVEAAVRHDGISVVRSAQREGAVRFRAADVAPGRIGGWAAYPAGVVWALRTSGVSVPDVELLVDSDIPVGAGLSSSAALCCAVGLAVTELAGADVSRADVAVAARRAENDYVGAPTGVMDQLASVYGRSGQAVFLDVQAAAVEHLPFDPAAAGCTLLVIDTRAPHQLVDGQYAARRTACEQAARRLGVAALRDVRLGELPAALTHLGDDLLGRRVRHVVTENERTLDVTRRLRSGADLRTIGPALTASHASLRDDFEVTVPPLDVAVDACLAAGAHGARMTGGGFGGCVLALVDTDRRDDVIAAVEAAFATAGFTPPVAFDAIPSGGARRLV